MFVLCDTSNQTKFEILHSQDTRSAFNLKDKGCVVGYLLNCQCLFCLIQLIKRNLRYFTRKRREAVTLKMKGVSVDGVVKDNEVVL